MIKGVFFDLDGTLINTLKDLHNSVNFTMEKLNLPKITIKQTQSYIGNGVKMLLTRASDNKITNMDEAYTIFKSYYKRHIFEYSKPYKNIIELLKNLKENNYKMAIVSNKYNDGVNILGNYFFKDYIDTFIGGTENVKIKPEADMINIALKKLDLKNDEVIFVGDSSVDILTAKNANMKVIFVTYGFGKINNLKADYVINQPLEILDVIRKENENE